MNRFVYFLVVGLAFATFQIAPVEALDDPNMPPVTDGPPPAAP